MALAMISGMYFTAFFENFFTEDLFIDSSCPLWYLGGFFGAHRHNLCCGMADACVKPYRSNRGNSVVNRL